MKSVAIIENHKELRESIRRVLDAEESISVVITSNYAEDFLSTSDTLIIDVILFDYSITNDSGEHGLREIKEKHPTIKIIAMCTHISPEIYRRALTSGANAIIGKTSDVEEIVNTINTV